MRVTADCAMVVFIAVAAVCAIVVYKAVRLLKADADLHLLGLGKHKNGAFQGKVVWITGASQGLGQMLAQHFAKHGAKLILSARTTSKLEVTGVPSFY